MAEDVLRTTLVRAPVARKCTFPWCDVRRGPWHGAFEMAQPHSHKHKHLMPIASHGHLRMSA
eukprot:10709406-Alexandrium_andersonii.AAC.1